MGTSFELNVPVFFSLSFGSPLECLTFPLLDEKVSCLRVEQNVLCSRLKHFFVVTQVHSTVIMLILTDPGFIVYIFAMSRIQIICDRKSLPLSFMGVLP